MIQWVEYPHRHFRKYDITLTHPDTAWRQYFYLPGLSFPSSSLFLDLSRCNLLTSWMTACLPAVCILKVRPPLCLCIYCVYKEAACDEYTYRVSSAKGHLFTELGVPLYGMLERPLHSSPNDVERFHLSCELLCKRSSTKAGDSKGTESEAELKRSPFAVRFYAFLSRVVFRARFTTQADVSCFRHGSHGCGLPLMWHTFFLMFGIIETPSVRSQPLLAVRVYDVGSFKYLNNKTANPVSRRPPLWHSCSFVAFSRIALCCDGDVAIVVCSRVTASKRDDLVSNSRFGCRDKRQRETVFRSLGKIGFFNGARASPSSLYTRTRKMSDISELFAWKSVLLGIEALQRVSWISRRPCWCCRLFFCACSLTRYVERCWNCG